MVKLLRESVTVLLLIVMLFSQIAFAENTDSASVPPINPSPTSKQIPGKIIWHDLVTSNIKETQNFYSELFGWQFKEYGSGQDRYYLISLQGKPVGGLVPLTAKQAAENDNQWISYISVSDVTQAAQFVKTSGGKVILNKTQFKQQGELAIFADPEGALFGVLKSSSGDPLDGESQPGDWVWANLMVNNPEQTVKFYQGLASYGVKEDALFPQVKDYYLYTEKVARAGVVPLPTGEAAVKILPNWLPYIHVASINEAVMKTSAQGGKVILKPATQIFNGKLAIIADPGGAAVGLVELPQKSK